MLTWEEPEVRKVAQVNPKKKDRERNRDQQYCHSASLQVSWLTQVQWQQCAVVQRGRKKQLHAIKMKSTCCRWSNDRGNGQSSCPSLSLLLAQVAGATLKFQPDCIENNFELATIEIRKATPATTTTSLPVACYPMPTLNVSSSGSSAHVANWR